MLITELIGRDASKKKQLNMDRDLLLKILDLELTPGGKL
ncbi:hypothetical protein DOT_0493 [Desulfosporosinus sp. OT]|nr:hypothetical protein DOT_0493 [Desulfosporosinus sp. OT]